MDISLLKGKTLTQVSVSSENDEIIFTTSTGERYKMYHQQSCCESVYLQDVTGDLQDLVGEKILDAYGSSSSKDVEYGDETWTFYHIRTARNSVALRWIGTSNGYYSTSVDFAIEDAEAWNGWRDY